MTTPKPTVSREPAGTASVGAAPVVGGVCGALAEVTSVRPVVLRVLFSAAVIADGIGVLAYAVGYVAVVVGVVRAPVGGRAPDRVRELGAVALAVGAVLLVLDLRDRPWGLFLGALLVCGGLAVGLRGRRRSEAGWLDGVSRLLIAVAVFGAGVVVLVAGDSNLTSVAIAGFVIGLVAVALAVTGMVSVGRRSDEVRLDAARQQARAEVSAHLHDSVLQSLALIQRNPDDAPAVASIARRQERELRRWLYDGDAYVDVDDRASFATALRRLLVELEDRHAVAIRPIIVGDALGSRALNDLLAATREAVVNAATWSGCDRVAVYAECDDAQVAVYVRDRGGGFRLEDVPGHRRGVRDSIVARVERAGGRAEIMSSVGTGTEIVLTMPR